MIPVMQTTFYSEDEAGKTRGNCFVACVASIMEFPIQAVPDWPRTAFGRSNWMLKVQQFLDMFDLEIETEFKRRFDDQEVPSWLLSNTNEAYYIVSGPSPRFQGRIWHSCIWHKGKIVHDPFPDGGGLASCRQWERIAPVAKWNPAG